MKLICTLFGHAPLTTSGYCKGVGYAAPDKKHVVTDAVGVQHITITAKCPRCGEQYDLCRIHGPVAV